MGVGFGLRELLYGFLFIVITGVLILIATNSFGKIPEFVDNFIKTDELFPHEVEQSKDRFENYFNDEFLDKFKGCRDSENSDCWCFKEEFEIPNKFSVEIIQGNGYVEFNLLDNKDGKFVVPYVVGNVNSCIISDNKLLLNNLEDKKAIIKKDSEYFIIYEDSNGKQQEINVNPSNLFYKSSNIDICLVDALEINNLKQDIC